MLVKRRIGVHPLVINKFCESLAGIPGRNTVNPSLDKKAAKWPSVG